MDPDRRHSQVGTIAPLPDQTEIHLHSTPGSKADILIQRLKNISADLLLLGEKTTENCLNHNKAVLLERRTKLLLHEYLKWFGFSPLLLDLFASLHSLHKLLGKQASSADLRKQLEKAIRRKHVSEGTQAEDLMLWFCRIGATSDLLQFLHDTGSSIVAAAPLDAFTRATPVDVAVANVQPLVLDWLLQKGASFESKASDGSTSLHVAIRNFAQLRTPESKSVVELLIPFLSQGSAENHGGNLLNIENESGSTVLDIALDAGLNVDTLTKAGAKRSSGLRTYQPNLMKAIEADDGRALTKLLDNLRNVDIDLQFPDGTSLLHFAVLNQSFCSVQTLLKNHKELGNSDVNSRIPGGWTALHLAVCLDNLAITTLLVQNGADINASSYEGNGWATVNKDLAFGTKGSVSFMRSPCPNGLRGGSWKPLHIASVAGNEPIVRLLVENGAMPHSKDLEGCTAIQRAIMNGHAHLAQAMVEQNKQTRSSAPQAIQSGEATTTRESDTGSNPDSVYQNLLGESRTALHDGVQAGNETIVKFLLQNGWNPNSREPGSMWTPLSYAVAQEDRALIRLLLKHRADPRSVHADGSTSLHIAAEGEKDQTLQDILPLCSVTLRDSHGATPLHYAARKGFAATTKLLLKSNLHVDLRDMANQTALFVAIGNANLPVARLLLDYGAVTNIEDNSRRNLLHAAASSGSPSALELVASRGKFQSLPLEAMDIHGRTPLQVAAEKHDAKMVQALLQLHRPRDLWRPILSVLFAAAATGNDAVLHTILDYNTKFIFALSGDPETAQIANINGVSVVPKKSWTLLHAAAWSGQTSTVRSLLQRGVSGNTETAFSLTPLGLIAVVPHDQLLQQHLTIAALLISHGGSIFKGGFGNTPLHLAALAGHNGLVTILLSRGASVAWENWEGELALHCAVHSGHSSVASTLIEHGSNAKQLSKRNLPPLHEAVLAGNLDMVKGLFTAGINTDLFAPDGITALHVASSAGKIEIIRHLLNNGTGLEWRTTAYGLSPLDVAASNGQLEAVKTIMDSPPYKSTHNSDTTYAWIAASKAAAFHPKICKYIYDRTNCQRDLGAGILHWAIAQDSRSLVAFLVDIKVDFRTPTSDGWSALHTAAMKGRISIARAILDEGFDVNYKSHLSRTALHQAVAADQAEAVSFLLSNGADINLRDENSQLPIHIAIDYGALNALRTLPLTADDFNTNDFNDKSLIKLAVDSEDGALLRTLLEIENSLGPGHIGSLSHVVGTHDTHLIRQLLDHGAELNTKDQKGFSPLREAVVKRNLEAAALLVERGADLESKCSLGITPLAFAAKSNDLEMARLLIRHGANLNATETVNGCPILIAAAECGHVDMVDLMIQSGCDIHCRTLEGNTALHVAAQKRQPEVIRSLIQGGLPIDVGGKENQSALYCASRLGLSNIASMLIDLGADLNRVTDSGFAPLHDVAESDKVMVMYVLLKHGANINCADSSGRTPVMMAASGGSESTFRMLRAHGAELNIVSDLGWTILHFAARGGCVGIAKLLVEDGYDLNTKELGLGHSPLLTAARHGHLDFIRYLAEEGANMYATSSRGENAVHIACSGGETKHIAVVKLLIDLGLVCDQASDSGHTPLMLAAEHKSLAMVTMLVEHGAKLDIITERGYGPLHAAAQGGNVQVLDFLLEHGLQLSDARAGPSQDTLLHIAAAEGHEDMVEAIAKRLPSLLTLTNQENFNPLQLALRRHRFGSMKKLHELGADINVESPKQRQTLIHLASKLEKPDHLSDIMGYLLQEGVSLESVTSDGFTPLKLAASLDRPNAAAALLDHGASIESQAGKKGRALDMAVKNGSSRVVELLVSKGASTSHLNYQGETLLYCAVCADNVEVVKSLLQRNTGLINSLSVGGKWAPLHSAVANNNVDIIQLLLENGTQRNPI
jgi:ankyrin repeat protein